MRIGALKPREPAVRDQGIEHLGTTCHMNGCGIYRNIPEICEARRQAIEMAEVQGSDFLDLFRSLGLRIRDILSSIFHRAGSKPVDQAPKEVLSQSIQQNRINTGLTPDFYIHKSLGMYPRSILIAPVRPRGIMAL